MIFISNLSAGHGQGGYGGRGIKKAEAEEQQRYVVAPEDSIILDYIYLSQRDPNPPPRWLPRLW